MHALTSEFNTMTLKRIEQARVALPEDKIEEGTLIWYSGNTSMGGWNCPAMITNVNHEKKMFQVISLDDMKLQDGKQPFDPGDLCGESRLTMRLIPREEAVAYVKTAGETYKETLAEAQKALRKAKAEKTKFMARAKELKLL